MATELHFAPMQGYADADYLIAHRRTYGGGYLCYTPFIRVEHGAPRRQDMARLERAAAAGLDITPQIIFRSVDEFDTLADAVRPYTRRIDLNLGCPYPMQTRRGRGAAMIADTDTMRRVCASIATDKATVYSVKMRLGLTDPSQWRPIVAMLNDTPLRHITVHPRTASEMYDGAMHLDQFDELTRISRHPVIFNGGILSPADIDAALSGRPGIAGVMIGRGMLARPSLVAEWLDGTEWPQSGRIEKIMELHDTLLEHYEATLCGDTQILNRIRPFWEYLEPEIGRRAAKAIRKASTLAKYIAAVSSCRQ